MENSLIASVSDLLLYTFQTLKADGWYLFISIAVAVALTVYIDPEKTRSFFLKQNRFLMPGSVGLGAFTPLCSCGTMAVVISLLTTALPWGPVMAFLVSSPLMSPDTFVLISGFMGFDFALALAVSSVVLGLVAGYLTIFIERKTGFLDNQFRHAPQHNVEEKSAPHLTRLECCTSGPVPVQQTAMEMACCSGSSLKFNYRRVAHDFVHQQIIGKLKLWEFANQFYQLGIKKIVPLFLLFVMIAYVVKNHIPTEWIVTCFNGNNPFSVPLAAIIGLPLYVSDSTIAPLLQVLKEAGASEGSLLAFMISGPGTSLAVMIGLNVIIKRKALLLYVFYLFAGAILLGYAYDFLRLVW